MVFALFAFVQMHAQNLITDGLVVPTNVNLCDAGDCYDLTADYFIPKDASSQYTVNSIPYDPVTVSVPGGLDQDDTYSDIIDLPFTFCYFGNASNQIVIGGNGDISFDITLANQFNPWNFDESVPDPNLPSGGIFGAYHDLDISVGGTISYGVTGTAPFRAFVINYSVAHFSCNDLTTTQQIVLHETSNYIDVYIEDKPTCTTWNDGNAVIGIQNIGGTIGYAAPGRNTSDSPWQATNEAWRFAPDGADLTPTFQWLNADNSQLSTNTTVQVCPTTDTSYTAQVEYTYCDGSLVTNEATVNVSIGAGGVVDLGEDFSICNGSPFTLTADGAFADPVAYEWSFNGAVQNGETGQTLTATALGTYSVTVTYGTSSCTVTDEIIVSAGELNIGTPVDLTLEDDDVDGMVPFDLTVNEAAIADGTTGLIFTYYETMADAVAGTSPIGSTFTNATNPDEVFVHVEDPATGCTVITSFNLYVITPVGSCFEVLPGTGPNGEYVIDCDTDPCVTINTSFTDGGETTNYDVTSIAYNPPAAFSGLANSQAGFVGSDDPYSDIIDIPFTFSYFGSCYTQLIISTNGMISFDIEHAGNGSPFTAQALPYTFDFLDRYNNTIFGVHQDIHPNQPADGEISWETIGTAPNRMFVVSYNNLYSYSCTSEGSTFQMVLHESSNEIDVFIETRCNIRGTVGVQNGDGSVGVSAPGRNGTIWNTTNEAWKFTPSGAATADYTVTWYDGITPIGTGDTIEVCPTENTTYFAQLVDNVTGDMLSDTATVLVNGINFELTGISGTQMFCAGQNTTLTADSPETDLTYQWQLNNVDIQGETSSTIVATEFGTYTVIATNSYGCTQTASVDVTEDLGCFLTEGISPNGDGLNDVLDAEFLDDRSGIQNIQIFNRHGVKVYERARYRNEWFGQSDDGDELPTGTYYYIIKLDNVDPVYGGMVKKWIYINRES